MRRLVTLCLALAMASLTAEAQRKKKSDPDYTQQLAQPPELPATVTADASRLSWAYAPLSARGLLSQQTRDGLKALVAAARGARFVRVRAFVAGTGDLRRVQSITSEVFSERNGPLPVLTVVHVGALPVEGAQVQLEATLEEKKTVNPNGVAFVPAAVVTAREPTPRVAGLVAESVRRLAGSGVAAPADFLRVTCYVTSLEDVSEANLAITRVFPRAAAAVVQPLRSAPQSSAACEATAKRSQSAPPSGGPEVAYSGPGRLILASAQLAFRYSEDDARLAFQRLDKSLAAAGASLKDAIVLNAYPLSEQLSELVRKVRASYFDPRRPPPGTLLEFEGLPGLDASFALEAIVSPGAPKP